MEPALSKVGTFSCCDWPRFALGFHLLSRLVHKLVHESILCMALDGRP